MEVRESKAKNLFWAITCTVIGSAFLISCFVLEMSYWIISIGALILLSSTLFFWAAFSSKLVVSLSNDGIWTYVHSKWIPWYDVESITINDGMLVVAISDVEKHFPESSAFTKNLLKRTVIDLARTDVNKMELFDLIDSKFTGSQLK